MKNKIFTLLFVIAAITWNAHAEVELATFEEPEIDMFDATGYNNDDNGSLQVVANPVTNGINTSSSCLKNNRKLVDWSNSYGKLYSSAQDFVTVSDANRYLHIMVYADISIGGCFFIRTSLNDDLWQYQGDDKGETKFNFKAGEWTDVVIDLKAKNFPAVYGLYFLSQDYSAPAVERNFYYDEIVINNDPLPRGTSVINAPATLANFEEGGSNPEFTSDGTAMEVYELAANPETSGLNKTARSLYAKTLSTNGEWWTGARVTFTDQVLVNDQTRYLHVLIKTTLPKFEFMVSSGIGDKWVGSYAPQTTDWFDYIIDLKNTKDGSFDGALVTAFRIAFSINEAPQRGKEIYIDEIVVNGNPDERVPGAGPGTGLNNSNEGSIYTNAEGVVISGLAGQVTIYTATGVKVYQGISGGELSIPLEQGMYIVSINKQAQKIVVW